MGIRIRVFLGGENTHRMVEGGIVFCVCVKKVRAPTEKKVWLSVFLILFRQGGFGLRIWGHPRSEKWEKKGSSREAQMDRIRTK